MDCSAGYGGAVPGMDACGCPSGTGWSITTGRGCCKAGSATQLAEEASCQAFRGNMDCGGGALAVGGGVSYGGAAPGNDACGCPAGTGWSISTGRGCCKAGSVTQVAEQASCQAARGNMNCAAGYAAVSAPAADACGCPAGTGWSISTGRGCCNAGSVTQLAEEASCQAARGNLDCAAAYGAPAGGADACGCPAGTGWSISTGRGCCKAGSVTQLAEEASCQAARGNMDCAAAYGAPAGGADACGCPAGTGWSISTGRGCCKAGSVTQLAEEASCLAARGNMDCAATADACGCAVGFGWSVTTGRGCCKAGSVTQLSEQAVCQATRGNTDCAAGFIGGAASGIDACGCPAGTGWSISTGRGCCKGGSVTQVAEEASCQSAHGNMDCAAYGAPVGGGADACGCPAGTGWSISTGRGCCKQGSVTQLAEEASCQSARGNTDCAAAYAPAVPAIDACGCPAGFGWSVTTGRGCCKAGSLTSAAEEAVCHAAHGNMDCAALYAPSIDSCGCPPGTGWSITTGRGCCKAGSVTQLAEEASCQASHGNMDCTSTAVALPANDACGCPTGFGWSVTTGRGCCKAGSVTQLAEQASCQTARGNTDCRPTTPAADACGCPAGTGWSTTTGRGCCKAGSNTQVAEEASCQAFRGNMDCTAAYAPAAPATDACGCPAGFGWSVTTGRGCCKQGSVTQLAEEASCQSARGNTDCAAPYAPTAPAIDACGCPAGFGWSGTTGRGSC
jgi:hypothetical protein